LSLKSQKRLAASILKIGKNRVWIDPEQIERTETAITRDEVTRLIHEGIIKKKNERGISKSRVRKRKRRRGSGSIKGTIIRKKILWINKIRKLRKNLKILRDSKRISKSSYRILYLKAKGGAFRNAAHLKDYIKTHGLSRRR
jgi:large subunit ribosomal protein L19e